jgi:hypothetical protein
LELIEQNPKLATQRLAKKCWANDLRLHQGTPANILFECGLKQDLDTNSHLKAYAQIGAREGALLGIKFSELVQCAALIDTLQNHAAYGLELNLI